jgi:hypothetical protein
MHCRSCRPQYSPRASLHCTEFSLPSNSVMAYGADMPISRRKFVAGSSLFGLFKSEKQRGLEGPPHFSPAVAKVTLARAAIVVDSMKTGPRWEAPPIGEAHAAAEALFAHFEETRFTDFLDQWLTQYRPPSQADAAAAMRECGLSVSEEIVSHILTCDSAEVAGARQTRWASLQALLLRGFETAMTRDRRKFVRVAWEPQRQMQVGSTATPRSARSSETCS